jgi:hypothetical protein
MVSRYREHELVLRGRPQATSSEAWRDDRRRRHLMEGSFAQSANCHGCKRARWRRLWRQQIQDWLIAARQNAKTLVSALRPGPLGESWVGTRLARLAGSIRCALHMLAVELVQLIAPRALPSYQLR